MSKWGLESTKEVSISRRQTQEILAFSSCLWHDLGDGRLARLCPQFPSVSWSVSLSGALQWEEMSSTAFPLLKSYNFILKPKQILGLKKIFWRWSGLEALLVHSTCLPCHRSLNVSTKNDHHSSVVTSFLGGFKIIHFLKRNLTLKEVLWLSDVSWVRRERSFWRGPHPFLQKLLFSNCTVKYGSHQPRVTI